MPPVKPNWPKGWVACAQFFGESARKRSENDTLCPHFRSKKAKKSINTCQQRVCNIDLAAVNVNSYSFLWDIPHSEHNEPSTRRRHGLVPVGGFFLPKWVPGGLAEGCCSRQMISNGLEQHFRLRESAGANRLASLEAFIGRDDLPTVFLQQLQVPLG